MFYPDYLKYFLIFVGSWILSLILTPTARYIAHKLDFMAYPGEHKNHESPTPYLGGVAVLLGTFIPLLIILPKPKIFSLFALSIAVGLVGLMDDYYDISAVKKFIVLLLAAFIATQWGFISNFFAKIPGGHWIDSFLTIFWTVFLISAFNALDHLDGLAPGTALIAALMFFIVGGIQFHQPIFAVLSIALGGALFGFIFFNITPSSIFLGDSGSYFLGFLLALISVEGQWSNNPVKAFLIPVVILSVPVADLIFLIFYRYAIGKTDSITETFEYSARDHISHRIQQIRSYGNYRTLLIIYLFAVGCGLLGVIMRHTHPLEAILALIIVGIMYSLIILLLLPNLNNIDWRWED